MENSKIEWCDHTFNPWIGCSKVSPGCKNCYAETLSNRYGWVEWGPHGTRKRTSNANWRKPLRWNREAARTGKRTFVFCASLADIFESRHDLAGWRADLFDLIENTPHLTWLLLTKRPSNLGNMLPFPNPPKNIALGTTVENQDAVHRIPWLQDAPSLFRFVSMEPLLGPVDLGNHISLIDWVIVGGESGPSCRPFKPAWAEGIMEQCRAVDIPFFMKQLGGHPYKRDSRNDFPENLRVREFPTLGKKGEISVHTKRSGR